eukprot:gene1108-25094_t
MLPYPLGVTHMLRFLLCTAGFRNQIGGVHGRCCRAPCPVRQGGLLRHEHRRLTVVAEHQALAQRCPGVDLSDISQSPPGRCYAQDWLNMYNYDGNLRHWEQHFPKGQLHALPSDDIKRDPVRTMRRIETLLGLPPHNWTGEEGAGKTVNAMHQKYEGRALDKRGGD